MRTNIVTVLLLLVTWLICFGVCRAFAADNTRIADAIQILQPSARTETARRWAGVFRNAGNETWIDPLLLVALSMRESSLLEAAETGEYRGQLGEAGLLQVHGAALAWRPSDCDLPLVGARCQIHTGARVLQYWREACPGSTYRWVSAYGRGECPSEAEARSEGGVRLARRYYLGVGGERWD